MSIAIDPGGIYWKFFTILGKEKIIMCKDRYQKQKKADDVTISIINLSNFIKVFFLIFIFITKILLKMRNKSLFQEYNTSHTLRVSLRLDSHGRFTQIYEIHFTSK